MKMLNVTLAALAVAGFSATAMAADAPGKAVFMKNGCIACHTIDGAGGKVGPNLEKVGAKGKDYIKESILTPNKVVVQGFAPNIMPQNFKDKIQGKEFTDLVDWLASHK